MRALLIQASLDGAAERATRVYRTQMPMLGLLYVAAATPPDIAVHVVDEANGRLNELGDYDLVGISGMTMHANHMYELADRYRARGAHVALGGVHVSFLPEEGLEHADTVFVGESDLTWPVFLDDLRRGRPGRVYSPTTPVSLAGLPRPDLRLVDGPAYQAPESTLNAVSATRGCPNTCSFCCVRLMFGGTVRQRPVGEVVDEVSRLEDGLVIFQDDNIVGNQRYAAELFAGLAPLGRRWGAQASINVTNNDRLLGAMADSGCGSLFIGFESVSEDGLAEVAKGRVNKARRFRDQIAKLHDRQIMIVGSFIVGLDSDGDMVFDAIYDFVEATGIEFPVVNCLTPFPGTPLYAQLESQGRIIDHDWEHYDLGHVVIRPAGMEPETLQNRFNTLNHYLARLTRRNVLAATTR